MKIIRLSAKAVAATATLISPSNLDRWVVQRHANGDVSFRLPPKAAATWDRNRRGHEHLSDDEFFLKWLEKAKVPDGSIRRPIV